MRGQLFFGTPRLQVPGSGEDDEMFLVNISVVDHP
jgi:hypothetical protein